MHGCLIVWLCIRVCVFLCSHAIQPCQRVLYYATTAFKPSSKAELIKAIKECLQKAHDENKPYDCSTGTNGAIGDWDVSAVTDMSFVFFGNKKPTGANKDIPYVKYSEKFNGDISKWDVSGATNMHAMFARATNFNGDISKWNVSSVTNMHGMFSNANRFNSDISKWTVSSVTMFQGMFNTAEAFNRDLNLWDVSRATNLQNMFRNAKSFSQTLCGAWATSKADKTGMFAGSSGKISSNKSKCPGAPLCGCDCFHACLNV